MDEGELPGGVDAVEEGLRTVVVAEGEFPDGADDIEDDGTEELLKLKALVVGVALVGEGPMLV